ncbi:MAG: WbqC family protein [Balneolaceae bacterium]|nr:WbqC family protein [Balneolaceae bacterium]MBO6545039.1 WbqC family protein [Balneolaceae bacterium]MBO6646435.1 WbqC family protein [Balneolaceae bacterium]
MTLAILTPQFAPNLFDLASMSKADRVILQDVEKWSRKGRTHRAEIRIEDGTQWINLPVLQEDRKKAIKGVRLDHSQRWFEPFWNAIAHNYQNATWFDFYEDELKSDILKVNEFEYLLEFNLYFFQRILQFLELNIEFELASKVDGYSTFLDETVSNLDADVLYLEHNSKNYQRQSKSAEIALKVHPMYKQSYPGFEPKCSILDLLLNEGRESFRIIEKLLS